MRLRNLIPNMSTSTSTSTSMKNNFINENKWIVMIEIRNNYYLIDKSISIFCNQYIKLFSLYISLWKNTCASPLKHVSPKNKTRTPKKCLRYLLFMFKRIPLSLLCQVQFRHKPYQFSSIISASNNLHFTSKRLLLITMVLFHIIWSHNQC
jgi:hypothetical protein